jgi:hypothetical protein
MTVTEETAEHQAYNTKAQLTKRAMEYCMNITTDHYMMGMWQVHTQCDSQTHTNIFKFIIKREILKRDYKADCDELKH